MAELKKIWIEDIGGIKRNNLAIHIDWDNDRHQRVEVLDKTPAGVARALKEAGSLVNAEMVRGEI